MEDLEDDNEDTPLTIKLKKLVEVITSYAQIAAFFIFSTMLIFLSLRIVFSGKADLLSNDTLKNLLRCFTTAVAVIIVAVPDGLKLAVQIAMAFSISKMKEDNLLVKEMAASENLAYTNIICTGKTGTLTEGNMEVKEYTIGGQSFKFDPER